MKCLAKHPIEPIDPAHAFCIFNTIYIRPSRRLVVRNRTEDVMIDLFAVARPVHRKVVVNLVHLATRVATKLRRSCGDGADAGLGTTLAFTTNERSILETRPLLGASCSRSLLGA